MLLNKSTRSCSQAHNTITYTGQQIKSYFFTETQISAQLKQKKETRGNCGKTTREKRKRTNEGKLKIAGQLKLIETN